MSRWTATDVEAYDERAPSEAESERATFALGCFWGPDATFGALPGVVRTRVGYAGGETPSPTYQDVGDHSEAIQVDYDPEQTSVADLVDVAIDEHDTMRQPKKRQYQNVLFYESDAERDTIEVALEDLDVPDVETRVERLGAFTIAEPYHQKFNLSGKRYATDAFEEAEYDAASIRESPAAAKLNAVLAGRDVPELGALADRTVDDRDGSLRNRHGGN